MAAFYTYHNFTDNILVYLQLIYIYTYARNEYHRDFLRKYHILCDQKSHGTVTYGDMKTYRWIAPDNQCLNYGICYTREDIRLFTWLRTFYKGIRRLNKHAMENPKIVPSGVIEELSCRPSELND